MKVHCHKTKNGHPIIGMATRFEGGVVTLAGYHTSHHLKRENFFASRSLSNFMIPDFESGVNTPKSPPAGETRLGCAYYWVILLHQLVKYLRRQKRTQLAAILEKSLDTQMMVSVASIFQAGGVR